MIIFKKVQTHTENTCNVFVSKFLPTHIYLPSKSFNSHPYQYLFALFLKNNLLLLFFGAILSKIHMLTTNLFNISTKQVQK